MSDTFLLLIIGLGMLGFGLITVFSILAVRNQMKQRRGGVPASSEPSPGLAPVADAPKPSSDPRSMPVLSLHRDRLTGELLVEIAGRRYGHPTEIQDASVWRGVSAAHRDLTQWLQTGESPVPPLPAPEPAPPPGPAPIPPADQADAPLPNMNPFHQMKILRERAKAAPPGPKSMVEQIDEVLQKRLAGSPYASLGIRMQPSASGGVQIVVGRQRYDGVDAVPDPGIQALIREAVKEWETRR